MKNFIYLFFAIYFISCEDVVEVDLQETPPKLVIEATIEWEKGTAGNEQEIKLSLSTPYFANQQNTPAIGAIVSVRNLDNNTLFNFTETTSGHYTINNFVPILNNTYALEIIYENEVYKGQEILKSVSDINSITQTVLGGFDDELIEVNIFFDDPIDEENYYLTLFQEPTIFPDYFTIGDEFTNGNEMTMFYEAAENEDIDNQELNVGDVVNIELAGVSKRYSNYISLLLDQTESGGPFGVTPAAVIGNCVNETNTNKVPFGYFRLSEVVKTSYTIQ